MCRPINARLDFYMYVCLYVCVCGFGFSYVNVHVCVCLYVRGNVMCVCMYVCMFVCSRAYVHQLLDGPLRG